MLVIRHSKTVSHKSIYFYPLHWNSHPTLTLHSQPTLSLSLSLSRISRTEPEPEPDRVAVCVRVTTTGSYTSIFVALHSEFVTSLPFSHTFQSFISFALWSPSKVQTSLLC
jgi:hypothetical protein